VGRIIKKSRRQTCQTLNLYVLFKIDYLQIVNIVLHLSTINIIIYIRIIKKLS